MKQTLFIISAIICLCTNAQVIPSNIPTNGLIGYWPFSNNTNDISGNNNHGAGTNLTSTTDRYGNLNSAYEFNGISSNVLVPHSSSFDLTNAFTVSFWMKSNTTGQNSDLIEKLNYTGLGDGGFQVVQRTNGIIDGNIFKNNVMGTLFTPSVVSTTSWDHIVLTWDGNTFKMYQNLVLNGQTSMSGPFNPCSNPLAIGFRHGSLDNYFNGKMDDIAIWNRALSFAEISGINCAPNSKTITPVSCVNYIHNAITYTATGVYTQTLTNIGGCDSILTIDLTIKNPTANTITVTECGNYTENAITYTTTGIYTQTLTNNVGCDSILTIDLTIENIDATVTQVGNILTANAAGLNYQWIDCNNGNTSIINETSQTYTATSNGNYAVVISSSNCTVTSICYNISTTGINLYDNPNTIISIYPNPANHSIQIQGIDFNKAVYVKIISIDGKIMKDEIIYQSKISISDLTSGMYFIELIDNKGKSDVTKFIKQ